LQVGQRQRANRERFAERAELVLEMQLDALDCALLERATVRDEVTVARR
jgi:hypothetical protein